MPRVSFQRRHRSLCLIALSIVCGASHVVGQKTLSISVSGTPFDFVWVPVEGSDGFKQVEVGDFDGGRAKERKRLESIYAPFARNGQRGYYLGKTEVTQEQWASVMGEGDRAKLPVTGKTYSEVQVFLDKINAMVRQSGEVPSTPDGAQGVVKLPTEAEWEYAARGGEWSGYGESDPYGGDLERYEVFSLPGSDGKAKEVGLRPPNRLGLQDMLGNVRELMEGNYSVGGVAGGGLLLKGGSYLSEKGELRSSSRTEHQRMGKDGKPTQRPDAGLRLAISAEIMTSLGMAIPETMIAEQVGDDRSETGLPRGERFQYAPTRSVDGFDMPVGKPDAQGYIRFRGFTPGFHTGDDWTGKEGAASSLGAPVYSSAHGLVVYARDASGEWGKTVITRHAYWQNNKWNYVDSFYSHLHQIFVRAGQQVRRGQLVGSIGTNNGMYEPHLHFEIRKNLRVGVNQDLYRKDVSNYHQPFEFIMALRQIEGGNRRVTVPVNTFRKGDAVVDTLQQLKREEIALTRTLVETAATPPDEEIPDPPSVGPDRTGYRKAAERGDADAQNNLGASYANGNGVPQNYALAVKWYRRSAKQNNSMAQKNLGVCYYNGQGVPRDFAEAYKWYAVAAANGERTKAAMYRDDAAARLSPSQLSQAQAEAAALFEQLRKGR